MKPFQSYDKKDREIENKYKETSKETSKEISKETNKEPQILELNTTTVKDERTLRWVSSHINSRWDKVILASDYVEQSGLVGIIWTTPFDKNEFNEKIDMFYPLNIPLFLSPQVYRMKPAEFWEEYFSIIQLGDLSAYPFLDQWDGTDEDAIVIFALLHRYHHIVPSQSFIALETRCKRRNLFNLKVIEKKEPECWLFTQFFRHASKKRTSELLTCLQKNLQCPYVDRVVLLVERDYAKEYVNIPLKEEERRKIKQVIIGKRLTYLDFLLYVQQHVPTNIYTILANADIYMGDSLLSLWSIRMENRVMALLRWDIVKGVAEIFGPRADSQDTWILLSDSIHSRKWSNSFHFQLGQPGCDNAFAGYLLQQRITLLNPALTFQTFHMHESSIRSYDPKDYIRAALYINLVPTYLIDTCQEKSPEEPDKRLSHALVGFEVKSSSMSNEITYCTMLEKQGRYLWEPMVENHYFQANVSVYAWKKAGVTATGLVHQYDRIFIGEDDTFWKNSTFHRFTPHVKARQFLAIPFSDTSVFTDLSAYLLYYVSRCLRLLELYPSAYFWIPKPFLEAVSSFPNFPISQGIEWNEDIACWADEVVGYVPSRIELSSEEIGLLRVKMPLYENKSVKRIVFLLDSIINAHWVDTFTFIESAITSDYEIICISSVHEYDKLYGASHFVFFSNNKVIPLWALPVGAHILEFQMELDLSGEVQHLAHICGLNSQIELLFRASLLDLQTQMKDCFLVWINK